MSEHRKSELTHEEATPVENKNVENARVESKLHLKINEDAKNVDFTFYVPNNCSWEFAKRGLMATFEQIVRLEMEDNKAKAEKEKLADSEPVSAELVS